MKLIVGLGNPGKEFNNTRHNVGFMVIDNIVKRMNLSGKEKFNGEYYEYMSNEKIILLKPLSFMNLSGEVVKKYIDYFNIDINDMFVIYDDMDMELGKIRLRDKGTAGGHNGIKNITYNLGTEEYKRIKIGIGEKKYNAAYHVLGKFSADELDIVNESVKKTVDIVENIDKKEFIELQNEYSG